MKEVKKEWLDKKENKAYIDTKTYNDDGELVRDKLERYDYYNSTNYGRPETIKDVRITITKK
jgi:hypothetical protein